MNVCIFDLFNRLDSTTYNHSIRVMSLAKEFESAYGFQNKDLSEAALVHDIGKIYISLKILDKTGSLSKAERELVNLHCYIGYEILRSFRVREDVCQIVLYHHGENLMTLSPVWYSDNEIIRNKANVLRTLDTFEALTSDRPYHNTLPIEGAIQVMVKEGYHHPDVVCFLLDKVHKNDYHGAIDKRYYVRDMDTVKGILSSWSSRYYGIGV